MVPRQLLRAMKDIRMRHHRRLLTTTTIAVVPCVVLAYSSWAADRRDKRRAAVAEIVRYSYVIRLSLMGRESLVGCSGVAEAVCCIVEEFVRILSHKSFVDGSGRIKHRRLMELLEASRKLSRAFEKHRDESLVAFINAVLEDGDLVDQLFYVTDI